MKTRLSHSALSTYAQCPKKFNLHYNYKLRSPVIGGALLFGSALDKALDHLLTTRNLEESKEVFLKHWSVQQINNKVTSLSTASNIVYAAKDWDSDLIYSADEENFLKLTNFNSDHLIEQVENLREFKKDKGFENFSAIQKLVYNYGHWCCLKNKGLVMLESYSKDILPKIKRVLASQKKIEIVNAEGDIIIGYIDFIVEWFDGKIYLLDNKTSSSEYDSGDAGVSQQLILYHHAVKEEFKIDGGVGFIVIYKQLQKNRKKFCTVCGHDGSEGRHKTCPADFIKPSGGSQRCNGEWNESINPTARIVYILNPVTEAAENLILETMDLTNQAIKTGVFPPNPNACAAFGKEYLCQFYSLCWKGEDKSLVDISNTK